MNKKIIALLVAILIVAIITGIIFAVYHQEENKTQNNNLEGTTTNNENVSVEVADDLVLINGGTFQMGSPESERRNRHEWTQ